MKLAVLLFATLKERAGRDRLELEAGAPLTVAALKALLAAHYPSLAADLPHALTSRNREYAFGEDELRDGDEVAFFPPVSGGAAAPTVYRITSDPIDLDDLVASITLPTTGAACVFTGMVRAVTTRADRDAIGPHATAQLVYEAYTPMAEAKLRQVADEIRARWPSVEGIALVQRIGPLDPGTPTVLIACSAAHRDTGVFEAARYGIDRLKEIVPVWKKEFGPAGEAWLEGDYTPTPADRRQADP